MIGSKAVPKLSATGAALLLGGLIFSGPGRAAFIVEELSPSGLAARAGLRSGDQIDSWRRQGDQSGLLASPLDLDAVQFRHAQTGPVMLIGLRDDEPLLWTVPPGEWDLTLRDDQAAEAGSAVATFGASLTDATSEAAATALAELRDQLESISNPSRRAWLLTTTMRLLAKGEHWALAETVLTELEQVPGLDAGVLGLGQLRAAHSFETHPDLTAIQAVYERAIATLEALPEQPFLLARALERIGGLEARRGQVELGQARLMRLLELVEPIAPESFVASGALNGLGSITGSQGDLASAAEYFEQVETILRKIGADDSSLRVPIGNLGSIAAMTGDLATAQVRFEQSLQISETTLGADGSAPLLNNLGIVAVRRGDLARAENYYQRALMLNEEAQQRYSYTLNLYNLADVASARGDLQRGIALLDRVIENFRELSPDSIALANAISASAGLHLDQGAFNEANSRYQEALRMYESSVPDTAEQAGALTGLGEVAMEQGDMDAAEELMQQALALRLAAAPRGIFTGNSHYNLAELYFEQGDLERAERSLRDSLDILSEVTPGSTEEARSLYLLARVKRAQGETLSSRDLYARAVAAIEQQTKRLGGADDSRSRFNDRYSDMFREYMVLALDAGDTDAAFGILERYRARSLLALLAERDLVLDAEVPEALRDERRRLARDYDALLAELPEAEEAARTGLRTQLQELRTKRSALEERLRVESPRFGSLQYPIPLDHAGATAALEPGTLALAYSVQAKATYVFSLRRGQAAPRVSRLTINEAELREAVQRLRFLIDSGRQQPDELDPELVAVATRLYDELLRPALEDQSFDRLLLVPDGPLHLLPFAALIDRTVAGAQEQTGGRYLIEATPVHQVLSLTLYQELKLRRARTDSGASDLIALATSQAQLADPATRALRAADYAEVGKLPELPWAKVEAEQITALFGASATLLAGGAATESRVKQLAPGPRYLHFATHSFVTDVVPLDSALVLHGDLTAEAGSNGLLQAWEIFEQVRLQTDLVVLSACESGLGPEAGGDGLIGLTRAFHHAGARAVVASLWRVADRSTSRLMTEFYSALRDGLSYDDALRHAQLSMIKGPPRKGWWQRLWSGPDEVNRFEHPFHWAAFTLAGVAGESATL